jgi:hypothetical protein
MQRKTVKQLKQNKAMRKANAMGAKKPVTAGAIEN